MQRLLELASRSTRGAVIGGVDFVDDESLVSRSIALAPTLAIPVALTEFA
jgi:hypothetical protein